MGRKKRWPPTVTKHSSGQARVRWKGTDYYLGVYGSPEATAKYIEHLQEWERQEKEIRERQTNPQGLVTLTVIEAMERFDTQELVHKPYKERKHYQRWYPIVRRVCKGMACKDLNTLILEQIRSEMINKSWSRGVVNAAVRRFRTMWRWVESQGYAPRGSWDHLRTLAPLRKNDPRVKTLPSRRPVDWLTVVKVCRVCRKDVRTIILLLWYTGMRPAEAALMRPCDLDRSKEIWFYNLDKHKNDWRGQPRFVALGSKSQKLLTPLLDNALPDTFLFSPDVSKKQRLRPYYTSDKLAQYIKRACKRAGVSMTAYQLRHAAKQRITRALGLDSARAFLGQSSLSTTDKYAAGSDRKLAEEVAKKLG